MPEILEKAKIPHRDQAQRLFYPLEEGAASSSVPQIAQQIIPFLGAGVSISGRTLSDDPKPSPNYPAREKLEAICGELGLNGQARIFLEMAILLACRLQFSQGKSSYTSDEFEKKLKSDDYPPSVGELAQLFSLLSSYTRFNQVAKTIRDTLPDDILSASDEELIEMLKLLASESKISHPPDPLTSITGYYESISDRASLWSKLTFIGKKSIPSRTHKLLAAAASHYLSQAKAFVDYLIITTNYDCLMEAALESLKVPYAVLVNRRKDKKVLVRFSRDVEDADMWAEMNSGIYYPDKFYLTRPKKLVTIYKIHGCLSPELKDTDDGIVISDSDYISYITQMGRSDGVIPSYVNSIMQDKRFLFLGYSLSDWNIRSIFETLREKRNLYKNIRDFAVMFKVEEYEKLFFDSNNVQIIKADLNSYVDGILAHLPEALRKLANGEPI